MRRIVLLLIVVVAPVLMQTSCQYSSCAVLNRTYPHGVGRPGAVDHVRGSTRPVTNFAVDAAVYQQNQAKLDRDRDGIACEKL